MGPGFGNIGNGYFGQFGNNMGGGVANAGQSYGTIDVQGNRDLANYGRQKSLQEQQNQNDLQKQAAADTAAGQRAQISANASTLPALLQQGRFQQVFPFLQQQAGAAFGTVGGQSQPLPNITVGGVYSPQQTQEQVNASRASNDRSTATAQKQTQQKLAGQGFGGNSPLLKALQSQQQMAGMQANSEAERGIRFDAAGANAKQQLASEQARQSQWAQNEDIDVRRKQTQQQGYNALLSALTGLV